LAIQYQNLVPSISTEVLTRITKTFSLVLFSIFSSISYYIF